MEIDFESGILDAEIGFRAIEQEPEETRPAVVDRHATELEAHDGAARRHLFEHDAPAHVPHQEVDNARIWGGIHYRNSTQVGEAMGRRIGALAVQNFLKPL